MPSTSPAADTAAWRELLPWATPEERRELLDSEHLAAIYFRELSRRGLGGLRQVEVKSSLSHGGHALVSIRRRVLAVGARCDRFMLSRAPVRGRATGTVHARMETARCAGCLLRWNQSIRARC